MTGMFEAFSRGYYLGQLYVEPAHRSEAAVSQDEYNELVEQIHGAKSHESHTPLVMRINQQHFTVKGARQVSAQTLALPQPFVEEYEPNRKRGVLLAKADVAERLLEFCHGDGDAGGQPQQDPFVPDMLRARDRPN